MDPLGANGAATYRGLFLRLADPEAFFAQAQVRAVLDALPSPDESLAAPDPREVLDEVRGWSAARAQVCADFLTALPPWRSRRAAEAVAWQSAPLGLSLGCWLQGMIAPGVCEDPTQLALLAAYAEDVGAGDVPAAPRREEFLRLLQGLGLPLVAARADALARADEIADEMFALPVALLAVSRRSDAFHAEVCAADLVLRAAGLPPAWAGLRPLLPTVQWERLDLRTGTVPDYAAAILAHYRAQSPEAAGAFATAVARFVHALRDWDARLAAHARAAADPGAAMAQLLRRRAREAAVYHHNTHLGGCPLSRRFAEASHDPLPLLESLARSRFVRPGDAGRSMLVNGLVSPRGRMFRVFPEHELATIREWINGLPAAATADVALPASQFFAEPALGRHPPAPTLVQCAPPEDDRAPATLREAYYLLQGRALPPALRGFAVDCVQRRLRRARQGPADPARALPAQWTAEGLRPWLLAQHDLHGQAFEEMERSQASHTREEVIRSTLRLAPLLLIDGAWLQGFTDLGYACSAVGRPLFRIFWDELGNGRRQLNHPKIYRDLLASMGVTLSETGSWTFACDPRFDDASFETPVYWLCLGKLSSSFQPEVLGMNLAMELSGVGDGYREASRFLRAHGFDAQFVDLHNTIDNVGTGHSAWAADAIDAYMSDVAHTQGAVAVPAAWARVRLGYDSLAATRGGALPRMFDRIAATLRAKSRPAAEAPRALQHRAYGLMVALS
jgi:hypothetical protein